MSKKNNFDVIVIGGGPAGYVAAIRCAQLGFSTACVDAWMDNDKQASLGGTCLNVGCIPSKALIESSELYAKAQHEFAAHGIKLGDVKLDLKTMLARKDQVVKELTQGIGALLQANKVEFFHGYGTVLANKVVEVSQGKKKQQLNGQNIIIATGSSPTPFAAAPFAADKIVDSTGALEFKSVPKRLAVIGVGVIGLELGSVWNRLGSEVFMLKSSETFLPTVDQQIANEALRQYTEQGLDIRMGAKIKSCVVKGAKVLIEYDDKNGTHKESVDKLVVAIGRYPNSQAVLSDNCGVQVDGKGFIQVDDQCRTAVPGIYAIGDVVRGPMLAHKGSEEGMMVAELIAGQHAKVDLDTVPGVIYTHPEIAWVGKSEEQLKKEATPYHVGSFPFAANGRARAIGQTGGLVKVLAHAKTDRILGVHVIGPQASEMVAQAKIAMELGASSEDLALTMFAHPTLSEALHEAALSVDQRAIHAVQAKKKR
jgi:dihydrolipoamide dehydrogenase